MRPYAAPAGPRKKYDNSKVAPKKPRSKKPRMVDPQFVDSPQDLPHTANKVRGGTVSERKSRNKAPNSLQPKPAEAPLELKYAGSGHVPFEGASDERSTITPTERRAFESIMAARTKSKKGGAKASANANSKPRKDLADAEDVQYDGATTSLDSLLDSALSEPTPSSRASVPAKERKPRQTATVRQASGPTELARDLASPARARGDRERLRSIEPIAHIAAFDQDIINVKTLMTKAASDVEVWRIFEERVLDVLKALGMDENAAAVEKEYVETHEKDVTAVDSASTRPSSAGHTNPPGGEKAVADAASTEPPPTTSATQSVANETTALNVESTALSPAPAQNLMLSALPATSVDPLSKSLSYHAWHAQRILAAYYPASSLALSVLPAIRALGPRAATFVLNSRNYDAHLDAHWKKYQDVPAMLALLGNMDAEVVPFTRRTRNTVWMALTYIDGALDGSKGPVAQRVWSAHGRRKGWHELGRWVGRLDRVIAEERARDAEGEVTWEGAKGGAGEGEAEEEEGNRKLRFVPAGTGSPGRRAQASALHFSFAEDAKEGDNTLQEEPFLSRNEVTEAVEHEVNG